MLGEQTFTQLRKGLRMVRASQWKEKKKVRMQKLYNDFNSCSLSCAGGLRAGSRMWL